MQMRQDAIAFHMQDTLLLCMQQLRLLQDGQFITESTSFSTPQ